MTRLIVGWTKFFYKMIINLCHKTHSKSLGLIMFDEIMLDGYINSTNTLLDLNKPDSRLCSS